MIFEIGTSQTWSYIQAQLDYPISKQRRVHIINGEKTLCGLAVSSAWEVADYSKEIFLGTWPCLHCQKAMKKAAQMESA